MKKLFCTIMVAGLLSLGLSGVAGAGPGFKPAQHDSNLGGNGGSALAHSVTAAQGLRGGLEGGVYIHRATSMAGKLQKTTGAPEVPKVIPANRHTPSDKPFLMPYEDVFSISGRGMVVTNQQSTGGGAPRTGSTTAGSSVSSDPAGDAGRAVAEQHRREMEALHKRLQEERAKEFSVPREAPQPIPTPSTWIDNGVDLLKKHVIINPQADPPGVPTIVPEKGFGAAIGLSFGF